MTRLIRYKSPRSPKGLREGGNRRFFDQTDMFISFVIIILSLPRSSLPSKGRAELNPARHAYWEIPMTPQAGRAPALPVFLLSSLPPWPRSSVPAWTTTVRPRTLSGPISLMNLSETEPLALPWASVLKLPRSPTWRSLSEGAPWVLLCGLTGGKKEVLGVRVRCGGGVD